MYYTNQSSLIYLFLEFPEIQFHEYNTSDRPNIRRHMLTLCILPFWKPSNPTVLWFRRFSLSTRLVFITAEYAKRLNNFSLFGSKKYFSPRVREVWMHLWRFQEGMIHQRNHFLREHQNRLIFLELYRF